MIGSSCGRALVREHRGTSRRSSTVVTDAQIVTFFWRPGCGWCRRLKRDLVEAGVALDERNIWEDPDAAAFVRSVARGSETVPTVVAAGTVMVNPPAHEVVALLP